MVHRQRVPGWLWVIVLTAAMVLPSFGASARAAQTASDASSHDLGVGPDQALRELRRHISQEELRADFERDAAALEAWTTGQPPRPRVDPYAQQGQTAAWTVMIYVAADNNLEISGLMDVNEMEGAGSSPDVNVLAQLDRSAEYYDGDGNWTGTRRYYIQKDDDARAITSPVLEDLGDTNSGDPDVLADFLIWGITHYPAEKYALVLWDHGGGWLVHTSDEATGDEMSLPETTAALDRVKAETGIDKLEFIGFDMCLMSQLEVYQTVAPYARYSAGSEENEPGPGWFYTFLSEAVKDPSIDGGQLGKYVVDYSMYYLREVVGDEDVYGLGVADLSKGDAVISALDAFTEAVRANPQGALSALADARNNTIGYGGFDDPQTRDIFSSVDLYRFQELLNDLSTDPALQQAAQGVMQAVSDMVLYQDHVEALEGSNGLSIYFPRGLKQYQNGQFNKRYPVEAPATMASWRAFLDIFYGTATDVVNTPPGVEILNVYPDVVSIYQPAVVTMEVSGRDILMVNYAVTYLQSETERVVLDYDYLVSRTTTPSGADIVDWSDGVTQRTFAWDAEVPMLTDGNTSTFALLIPNRDNPDVALVNGQYQAAAGGDPIDAQLLFNLNTQQSTALWGLNETASGNLQPFEIQVQPGDQFRAQWLTLDANNDLSSTSWGETLTLNSADSIRFTKVPAPSGTYSISFVAENVAGTKNLSEAIIQVNNDGLDPAFRGYTDLTYGVNFLYPANWIRPRFTPDGQRLYTADLATNTLLSLYPYTDVTSAEETDAAIRASWSQLDNLSINQQRQVEINGLPAYVTDYTYTFRGAPRLGAVVAIYVPDQGVGYAFDLDAPADQTAPAQQALQGLVGSINFFNVAQAGGESAWQTVTAADGRVSFPVPADWTPENDETWTLYGPASNPAVFVALATQPASGQTNEELALTWVSQLEAGVQDFNTQASEPFYIGGREWHVVVFTYQEEQKIAGAFFTTSAGDFDYTFWIEAPDADFDALYESTFSVTLGGFAFNE